MKPTIGEMRMKKINYASFILCAISLCTLPLLQADPVTSELLNDSRSGTGKPKIINYGYNKFITSPYSKKIAVISFDSPEGIARFEQSKYKNSFFKLAPHYVPQQTITNCGIASAVIILNTIYANAGKTPPLSLTGSHYDREKNTVFGQFIWTENNFYTPKIVEKLDQAVIEGQKKVNNCYLLGVTLDQLTESLKLQGVNAKAYPAKANNKESIEQFRAHVKAVTANPTQYMIAHYTLGVYLEDEGGHFSPVAAYDEASDSVLILDTWAAANSWIWIKLEDLYRSMNTLDGKTYRGYILIDTSS